jgi:hypothetical protein
MLRWTNRGHLLNKGRLGWPHGSLPDPSQPAVGTLCLSHEACDERNPA